MNDPDLREDLRRGLDEERIRERGLEVCRIGIARRVPFIYQIPCGLKLFFAFTPIDDFKHVRELQEAPRIDLSSLTTDHLRQILGQVYRLYNEVYTLSDGSITVEHIFEHILRARVTRLFVKGSVEALDLIRFHPDMPLSELLQ